LNEMSRTCHIHRRMNISTEVSSFKINFTYHV
jgi:hypothetical protein